ncbi:MAG: glycosyltransferase [Sedimentisphaerales bacterium]|nr:glycosyltransferase [Sedimentisphaerales bacterium]
MNVLLVTSAAPSQAPFSTGEKRPPAGIGFLISVLRNAGQNVFFIDNYLKPNNFLETDYLRENSINFVGIYANTICYRDTMRMFKKLQQMRCEGKWSGKIMVGGPHTTVALDTIPDYVDFIVQGEGEQAVVDIVEGKVNERVVCYPRLQNLDELPPPAWDYFVNQPYDWSMRFIDDGPVFTMNTSRGCPFKCRFCSVGSIWGKKYTYFSAERVVSEIEYLVKNYGAKGIYFREDNFTLNRTRLEKFCNLIIEKGLKIQWVCESRVSNLDADIMRLMARAGLKGFYFGVESGSQRMLDLMDKGITVEQIRNAFKLCKEANVKAAASIIVGVPGETQQDIKATQDLLNEIKPDVTWANVFVGIPDSSLYRYCLDNKLYEYIDDRGLVYLQGHNLRVKQFYGDGLNACIPTEESRKDAANPPKISVLMAAHNGEKYIGQALQSIYNQSFQDFEVVVVDDAGTDKTSDILLKMKDSRTSIYRNSKNLGLTKSLNIGLKLCRGEFVARMDADDISYPQRFAKQMQFFAEHPDTDVLGCWCHRIDNKGNVRSSYDGRPTEAEDLKKGLLKGNSIAHGTAMVRRKKLVEVGGYNENYRYSQDHDLWLRLSEIAKLRNLPEYLYGLRFWEDNITNKKIDEQSQFSQRAIQEALNRSKNRVLSKEVVAETTSFDGQVKFSVIMANYNNGKYIAEAIDSILNQTFSDWELVIVDDCSTDNSLQIINSYLNDKRIRVINHQNNEGYVGALRTAISNVRSEIFGILDSDDFLRKDALEIMYNEHIKNPQAGLIYSQFICCDENLRPRRIGFGASIPKGKTNLDQHVATAFRTFKLRDYLKTEGYDERIQYAEDRDICYKMEEVSGLKFVNENLYLYRELDYSQSHDSHKAAVGRVNRLMAGINAYKRRGQKPLFGLERYGDWGKINLRNIQDRYQLGLKYIKDGNCEGAEAVFKAVLDSCKQFFNAREQGIIDTGADQYSWICECYYVSSLQLAKCYSLLRDYQKVETVYKEMLTDEKLILNQQQREEISVLLSKVKTEKSLPRNTKNDQPLVSVIMPVYNGQKYLPQAIESVLSQDYPNFEVIIINDGSTDESEKIILSFKDDRIRYFKQENCGLAATHNEGIRKSRGAFVIKVDSDDYITSDFISKHIEEFNRCPEADLIYCDDVFLEDDYGRSRVHNKPEYTDRKLLIRDLFRCGFPLVPFRTCLKRSIFDNIGFFDESLKIGEDYDIMLRFVKAGLKVHHLRQALYYRRLGSDSLSRQYSVEKAKTQFKIIRRYRNVFRYDELFPDVHWDKIPAEDKELLGKSLVAMTYIQMGQFYLNCNLPDYARVALENADMQLDECVSQTCENSPRRSVSQSGEQFQKLKDRCRHLQDCLGKKVLVSV